MMWVIRFLLLILLLFLIYQVIKFLISPKRKLELAHEQKKYFLYDDHDNVRKNFLLTYKGVMFEGEKYLGSTKDSFYVISISIWPQQVTSLKGFVHDDFHFIEQKIKKQYQTAKIDWKSPVKQFLHQTTLQTPLD
jgi:cbb3-type cytochrome oxidase subunit 3